MIDGALLLSIKNMLDRPNQIGILIIDENMDLSFLSKYKWSPRLVSNPETGSKWHVFTPTHGVSNLIKGIEASVAVIFTRQGLHLEEALWTNPELGMMVKSFPSI